MVFVVAALVVSCLALLWALRTTRATLADLRTQLLRADRELVEASSRSAALERDVSATAIARDDALDRVQRARRDASEVAQRLATEAQLRADAERALHDHRSRLDETEAELASLGAQLATLESSRSLEVAPIETDTGPERIGGEVVETLWDLTVASVRRTFAVSIAVGPDDPCPIDGSDDVVRSMVEIEVEAAREESGTAVELSWMAERAVEPGSLAAVEVVAASRELVARARDLEHSTLAVSLEGGAVSARLLDDDGSVLVALPARAGSASEVDDGAGEGAGDPGDHLDA